jgi:hypothetical protein
LLATLGLAIAWVQISSLRRGQVKLIGLSPRSLQETTIIAKPKGPSATPKQQGPKPYAVSGEDPRLLAALSGRADAQYELGVAYARGEGVQSDYTVASTWLILAKANGDRRAENVIRELTPKLSESETGRIRWNLGEMYANGVGVRADKVTAYMWHRLAEAAGERRSSSATSKLASTMTNRELSEANLRASLWLTKHRLSNLTFLPVSTSSVQRRG